MVFQKWVAGDSEKMKPHHLLIAGALAGIPAASLTTPADVIKVRPTGGPYMVLRTENTYQQHGDEGASGGTGRCVVKRGIDGARGFDG